jgi:uncharacterized protein (TIGR03083 family)
MKLNPRYEEPPIISITGRANDQRLPLSRQRRRLQETLTGLDDEGWRAPSRCDGWTVHDVVAHLVGVNEFWNASVQAGLDGKPTRILAHFDPSATPPLLVAPMRTLTRTELLDQFVASNDAFLATVDALDDEGWMVLAESPPGHVPVRLLAQHALWDSWVHERDIALPLGGAPALEPDEVASCLQYAAALSPALAIISGTAVPGTYSAVATNPAVSFVLDVSESVSVHEGAAPVGTPCLRGDAVELVEALSLRASPPPATPAPWRRLLGGLATTFDVEVSSA